MASSSDSRCWASALRTSSPLSASIFMMRRSLSAVSSSTELEAVFGGPPATVLLAKPGGPQIDAVGDGTLTEPGRYLVACSIPVGADPDEILEAEGPPPAGGIPHFHKGMYAEVTVE